MAEKHSVGKAYIQVVPTTDGIKGQLGNLFGAEGSSAGSIFGSNLVSSIKNIMVTAGIGQIIKESLFAGADLQQSLGGVETLFKDSADIVISNAENAYKTAGLSANEYMEQVTSFSASLLQSLEGDTEEAAKAADIAVQDMADNANKMGTDMALIQNAYQGFAKANYTMLDNLKLGYGGTKSEMERLLKDATALSGIEYDIDNLNDVYSAIHEIQQNLGITGATAEEAHKTFSGSLAAMKAAATNVLADLTLGEDVGPALRELGDTVFTFVGGNLMPMVGNLLGGLPEIVSGSISMAIRGMNMAANNADELVDQGVDMVVEIASGVIAGVPYLLEGGFHILTSLGAAIMEHDWQGTMDQMSANVRDSLELAAGEIFGTDGSIIEAILSGIGENLPQMIIGAGSIITELTTGLMDNLPSVLAMGCEFVFSLAGGVLQSLPEIGSAAASVMVTALSEVGASLPEFLAGGISLVGQIIAGAISSIPDVIRTAGQIIKDFKAEFSKLDWKEIGANIISGIVKGLWNGVQSIIDAAWGVAESALSAAKEALGIRSPSTKARDIIGRQIPAGIAVGVEENAGVLDDAMTALSDDTMEAFRLDLTEDVEVDTSMNRILRLEDSRNAARSVDNSRKHHIEIHVHAAPGMDEDGLVDRTMERLKFELEKAESEVA